MSAANAGSRYKKLTQADVDLVCEKHARLKSGRPGGARAVFAWSDISGLDLKGRDLIDADFTATIMVGTDLTGARLDQSNFYCVDMQMANLSYASMRRVDLRGACLRGANLLGVDLFEADLREGALALPDKASGLAYVETQPRISDAGFTNLRGANLERSKLTGIQAMKADFTDAIMTSCKLVRANLKLAKLDNCDLSGADLSGADVSGASLKDAVLIGAKVEGWNATQADLSGVLTDKAVGTDVTTLPYDEMIREHALWVETVGKSGKPSLFDKADLRALKSIKGLNLAALSAKGAVFYGLDMRNVQLSGAQLEDADLRNCDLRGADLRGVRLTRARLDGANMEGAQIGPLILGGDRLFPADLREARIRGVNLRSANLRKAKMDGADLSRSDLQDAQVDIESLVNVVCVALKGKIAA